MKIICARCRTTITPDNGQNFPDIYGYGVCETCAGPSYHLPPSPRPAPPAPPGGWLLFTWAVLLAGCAIFWWLVFLAAGQLWDWAVRP